MAESPDAADEDVECEATTCTGSEVSVDLAAALVGVREPSDECEREAAGERSGDGAGDAREGAGRDTVAWARIGRSAKRG